MYPQYWKVVLKYLLNALFWRSGSEIPTMLERWSEVPIEALISEKGSEVPTPPKMLERWSEVPTEALRCAAFRTIADGAGVPGHVPLTTERIS